MLEYLDLSNKNRQFAVKIDKNVSYRLSIVRVNLKISLRIGYVKHFILLQMQFLCALDSRDIDIYSGTVLRAYLLIDDSA